MRAVPSLAFALALAAAGGSALSTVAEARSKRSNEITVTRRSYFDAGTMVKPGTSGALNYVFVGQGPLATPVYSNIDSRFGAETLPRRFELPNCCGVTVPR